MSLPIGCHPLNKSRSEVISYFSTHWYIVSNPIAAFGSRIPSNRAIPNSDGRIYALLSLRALLVCISSLAYAADAPVAVYSSDPSDLWNRLYRAMAVRTFNGAPLRCRHMEPYSNAFESREQLLNARRILESEEESSLPGEVRRALMLNDIWTAFDASTMHGDAELRSRLARAIERLRMPISDIARLEG